MFYEYYIARFSLIIYYPFLFVNLNNVISKKAYTKSSLGVLVLGYLTSLILAFLVMGLLASLVLDTVIFLVELISLPCLGLIENPGLGNFGFIGQAFLGFGLLLLVSLVSFVLDFLILDFLGLYCLGLFDHISFTFIALIGFDPFVWHFLVLA